MRLGGTVDWVSGDCTTTNVPYGMELAIMYDTERVPTALSTGPAGSYAQYWGLSEEGCVETSPSLPIAATQTTAHIFDDRDFGPTEGRLDWLWILAHGGGTSLNIELQSQDLTAHDSVSLPSALDVERYGYVNQWRLLRGSCQYGGEIDIVEIRPALACGVPDADHDGVRDERDLCLGDDTIDLDFDSVPDDCDVCPGDMLNDQDGDGQCTADDMCPHDFDDSGGGDDIDGDAVCNTDDLCPGGDDLADADDDLMADACDLCPADADNDADGDGVCGDVDGCEGDDTADGDGDGVPDACDVLCPDDPTNDADFDGICGLSDACPFDELDDSDGDGTCDSVDICPDADDGADLDGDSLPDCRDTCPMDVENDGDGDGICESADNCTAIGNAEQLDADGDGTGDACESDSDADGVIDDVDNCRLDANPSQADADADGDGDACDGDSDGDGVVDAADKCGATPWGAIVSPFGCSVPDVCPTTATWKNHGAYVHCVTAAANYLLGMQRITPAQRCALVHAAATSSVGS